MIGNLEDIPEGQDPIPEVVAYNEHFDTSFKGELLSVGCLTAGKDGDGHRFSVLWRSFMYMTECLSETGGDALKEVPRLTNKTIVSPEEQTSSCL